MFNEKALYDGKSINELLNLTIFNNQSVSFSNQNNGFVIKVEKEVYRTEKATLYKLIDEDILPISISRLMDNPNWGIYKWFPNKLHAMFIDKRMVSSVCVPIVGHHMLRSAFVGYDGQKLNYIGREEVLTKLTNYQGGIIPSKLITSLLPNYEDSENFGSETSSIDDGVQHKRLFKSYSL